jgi:hypothetical protein
MGESVYEKQKAPVAKSNDGVGGFADLKPCSKCGQPSSRLRKCVHCNSDLCQTCFYEKAHYTEYNLAYAPN